MALFGTKQIVTSRSAVTAGGAPPSGNHPVFSPFTGGARPRTPISSGPAAPVGFGPNQRIGVALNHNAPKPLPSRPVAGPAHVYTHYGF